MQKTKQSSINYYEEKRKKMIAAVHVWYRRMNYCPDCHDLNYFEHSVERCSCGGIIEGMSRNQYQNILKELIGKDSCKTLDDTELQDLLDKLRKKYGYTRRTEYVRISIIDKIKTLAQSVMGDNWKNRIDGYINKNFHKDGLPFCTSHELRSVFGFVRRIEKGGEAQ